MGGYVLACFDEQGWTFLNCVFGLGLGLRKRVHLGLDLGGLVLVQLDVEDLELVGLWAVELVGMLVQNYGWVGWSFWHLFLVRGLCTFCSRALRMAITLDFLEGNIL